MQSVHDTLEDGSCQRFLEFIGLTNVENDFGLFIDEPFLYVRFSDQEPFL